ncbi:hypothetical protein L7F22_048259 [Adiantum nelumboides]|nr:hypothetical protein [Adiantum nelumboides]
MEKCKIQQIDKEKAQQQKIESLQQELEMCKSAEREFLLALEKGQKAVIALENFIENQLLKSAKAHEGCWRDEREKMIVDLQGLHDLVELKRVLHWSGKESDCLTEMDSLIMRALSANKHSLKMIKGLFLPLQLVVQELQTEEQRQRRIEAHAFEMTRKLILKLTANEQDLQGYIRELEVTSMSELEKALLHAEKANKDVKSKEEANEMEISRLRKEVERARNLNNNISEQITETTVKMNSFEQKDHCMGEELRDARDEVESIKEEASTFRLQLRNASEITSCLEHQKGEQKEEPAHVQVPMSNLKLNLKLETQTNQDLFVKLLEANQQIEDLNSKLGVFEKVTMQVDNDKWRESASLVHDEKLSLLSQMHRASQSSEEVIKCLEAEKHGLGLDVGLRKEIWKERAESSQVQVETLKNTKCALEFKPWQGWLKCEQVSIWAGIWEVSEKVYTKKHLTKVQAQTKSKVEAHDMLWEHGRELEESGWLQETYQRKAQDMLCEHGRELEESGQLEEASKRKAQDKVGNRVEDEKIVRAERPDQLKEKLSELLKELNLCWGQFSLPPVRMKVKCWSQLSWPVRMKAKCWSQLSWPVRRKASWIRMQRYRMEQKHAKKVDALLEVGFMAEKGKWWPGRESPLAWLESGCKLRMGSYDWLVLLNSRIRTGVDEQTQGKRVIKIIISAECKGEAIEFAAEEDVFEVKGKANKNFRSWLLPGSWDLNSEVLAGLNWWAGSLGLKHPELGCPELDWLGLSCPELGCLELYWLGQKHFELELGWLGLIFASSWTLLWTCLAGRPGLI